MNFLINPFSIFSHLLCVPAGQFSRSHPLGSHSDVHTTVGHRGGSFLLQLDLLHPPHPAAHLHEWRAGIQHTAGEIIKLSNPRVHFRNSESTFKWPKRLLEMENVNWQFYSVVPQADLNYRSLKPYDSILNGNITTLNMYRGVLTICSISSLSISFISKQNSYCDWNMPNLEIK